MALLSCGGCLKDLFVTEEELIERFTGKELWLWGGGGPGGFGGYYSGYGLLGDNTTTKRSSPVQTISGGNNWRQVSLGCSHSAAIKTDGTLWLWGSGGRGQLGDNTTANKSSPVQTVSGGNNWRQVSLGDYHSAAIKTDGTLWLWGVGCAGRLGDNTATDKSSPIQTVSGGNNWRQVSLGSFHSAAIKTDGTLWLWGYGVYGQLGDNTITNKSSPVQTVSGGNNWRQVSLGGNHSAAIKTDGTLWLWGLGGCGRLGDNTIINRSSPVQTISGGTNWRQVSLGNTRYCNSHSAAIKTDGTLWLWGYGSYGQLGENTTASRSSPVQTVSGGNNWRQVSLGCSHSAAIKTDGTLWLWGYGSYGQLGENTTASRSSPIQTVSGGNNWRQVSLGNFHSAATSILDL
jgi:alpha-tubulin suppressor-like RCC1 family protein